MISAGPMPSPSWPAATWKPASCPNRVGSGPSCWSPWTWTAWSAATPAPSVARLATPSPLDPEACRRLACDGAVTRVLVTRHPTTTTTTTTTTPAPIAPTTRTAWVTRAAWPPCSRRRPGGSPSPWWRPHPTPGGRPHHPGRHRRPTGRPGRPRRRLCRPRLHSDPRPGAKPTISATGCMAAPPTWTNLALICRAHHRAVHEGGWRLTRDPDGRLTATPPHRKHPTHRRHPAA